MTWTQTYTGRAFRPLDPRPDDVDLRDLAHSLAMQCRFNGHCRHHYCVTPETRILTDNLEWVPAGTLRIGDGLLAFDEYPVPTPGVANSRPRRKARHATVLHDGLIVKRCYEITMSDGTKLRASAEHPWLVSLKVSRNQSWLTTEKLARDVSLGRRRHMIRFFRPWEPVQTYDAGWMAGIFDGEGHISRRSGGLEVGIAQKPGVVLDRIVTLLQSQGVVFRTPSGRPSGVVSVHLGGSWNDRIGFLGTYRPGRLLSNYRSALIEGDFSATFGDNDMLDVVEVRDIGDQEVVALETSTRTYFAEGFGAHNSVAQHSIYVALTVPPPLAAYGLAHDLAEAYLGDVVRPIKPLFTAYGPMEDAVMGAICAAVGLFWPWPADVVAAVKRADAAVLAAERDQLMATPPIPWEPLPEPPPWLRIGEWLPSAAEEEFLTYARILLPAGRCFEVSR